METIERINRNIKEAVAAINSCMPTAMEAAENIRKNLNLLSEVNSLAAPQLIQGYTAEQWQEIIDGGYLCEFKADHGTSTYFDELKTFGIDGRFVSMNSGKCHVKCIPAQIKGVMRPIFVEPVDKEAHVILVNDCDGAVSGCIRWWRFAEARELGRWGSMVKYIEV